MARLTRHRTGRTRSADGAAIRAAVAPVLTENRRRYADAVGTDPQAVGPVLELAGWQVPAELRRGFGVGDRIRVSTDDTVEVLP